MYMKKQNELVERERLDDYLKNIKNFHTQTNRSIKTFALRKMMEMHPYEHLFDSIDNILFINERGIDYFQEVILPYFDKTSFKKMTRSEKNELFNTLDFRWTSEWIKHLDKDIKSINDFIPKEDMKQKDFYKKFNIKRQNFYDKLYKHKELNECIKFQNQTRYIRKESMKQILTKNFPKQFMSIISPWIYSELKKNIKPVKLIYKKDFSEFQKKIEIQKVNMDTKKDNIKNRPPLLSIKKEYQNYISLSDLEQIKKQLKERHPHEQMIYKIWDTENNKMGELFFTIHGAEWYAKIYYYLQSERNTPPFIAISNPYTLEKEWMESLLIQENISLTSCLDEDMTTMMYIYGFNSIQNFKETMSYINKIEELDEIKKEDFIKLEQINIVFKLRRYSYLYSKSRGYQKSIIEYTNPVRVPLSNREWLEIDTCNEGWYNGTIINKPYYYGKGREEILTLNVKLNDQKKIKVRIPYDLYRDTAIQLLYVPYYPISFNIENINVNNTIHHRVKQIILGKQIEFTPNWDKSSMYFVPVPLIGSKKKYEIIDKSYLKNESEN